MSESIKLSPQELARYSRHIAIPDFNIAAQKKLKAAIEFYENDEFNNETNNMEDDQNLLICREDE